MDELSRNALVAVKARVDRAIVGALRGRDLSGFEIWRWLGSEGGTVGLLTEPALYPTLYRLEAERLLQSDWHEGERTRRTYRLTATALERAEENRWPALPFRGASSSGGEAAPPAARLASPGPETGSWFVPPKTEPVESAPFPPGANERGRTVAERDDRPVHAPSPLPSPDGDPIPAEIARYASDLGTAVDLPRVEADRVRQEIADHLTDSAAVLRQSGLDAATATAEAIARLGSFRDLATQVSQAQHTKDRRDRAVRRGLFELVGELMLWLAVSAVPLTVAPGLALMATWLARAAGLHLVVLTSGEWATNQMATMLCVGSFAAGRLSLGHLARISRHSDAAVRIPWAIGGAAAVLAVALLLPGYQDGLVVATLLAAPFAFIAGTYRPKHQNERAYAWRGIGAAVVLVAAVSLLPAGRLFVYDPNATPGAPLANGNSGAELVIYQHSDGTFGYELPGSNVFATVELWPASKAGVYIVVDRSTAQPALVDVRTVDLAKLPPNGQWWVAVVAAGPDGHRTTTAMVIQTGASPNLGTALSWLIARR